MSGFSFALSAFSDALLTLAVSLFTLCDTFSRSVPDGVQGYRTVSWATGAALAVVEHLRAALGVLCLRGIAASAACAAQ